VGSDGEETVIGFLCTCQKAAWLLYI